MYDLRDKEQVKKVVKTIKKMKSRDSVGLNRLIGKSKVILLNGEEGLESGVYVDGICLDPVSEFKYLGCFE